MEKPAEDIKRYNDQVRVMPFVLDDVDMLDIRMYTSTKNGPRPSKINGISIKRDQLVRLIMDLQKVNFDYNSDEANERAAMGMR